VDDRGTRNLCRGRLRTRLRPEWSWTAIRGGRVPLDLPDPQTTPEEAIVRAEAAEAVRRAVADLPAGQRDAVQLFYLDDRSHREVGAVLGLEVNAVKARLHRARVGLRPRLRPQPATTDRIAPPGDPAATTTLRTPTPENAMPNTDTSTPIELEIQDVRRRTVDRRRAVRRRAPGRDGRTPADLDRPVRGDRPRAAAQRDADAPAADLRHDGETADVHRQWQHQLGRLEEPDAGSVEGRGREM
jgi:hypothetical protein